jgi:hypothetical protein
MLIIEWQATGRLGGQAMTLIIINLVFSFTFSGISWGGHIGGLIGGILITLAYAHWGRGKSAYGQLGLGGAIGLWPSQRRASRSRTGRFAGSHSESSRGVSPPRASRHLALGEVVRTAIVYVAILGLLHLAASGRLHS